MPRLNIYDRRERALVAAADAALWPAGLARRVMRGAAADPPRRILCLRLERIGDLIMTIPAIAELRALAPNAAIDVVVGSWNREIAATIPGIDHLEILDAAWLTRDAGGRGPVALISEARRWRSRQYDLAINFEPDIRSNLLLAASGATRLAGFASGGGGVLLDLALDYDPRAHTADNALALVRAALGGTARAAGSSMLSLPEVARAEAARLLRALPSGARIGIHASGGRQIKQWPETRFAEVAARLIADRDAVIVLTGAPGDRGPVDLVKRDLPAERVLDLCGRADLVTLAAVLAQIDLLVTGDTGPMHLAHAVGTPVVAVFGPSDPARYAPRGTRDRIVRIDLPCSPCNRIRLPPARCTGHTPDCLAGIDVAQVVHAVDDVLAECKRPAFDRGASDHDPVASALRRNNLSS
jgi:ADP-heptose:LPS heptosyltransferase